jgi:hypothetical protein
VSDGDWVLCLLGTAFRKRSYRRACGVYGLMDKCTEQLDVHKLLNIINHVTNLSINIDSSYYIIHFFRCRRYICTHEFRIVL